MTDPNSAEAIASQLNRIRDVICRLQHVDEQCESWQDPVYPFFINEIITILNEHPQSIIPNVRMT